MFTHTPVALPPELVAETLPSGVRYYITPDGRRYPSITTVLGAQSKAGLTEWRNRVGVDEANKIARQAAVRGTKIHLMAEQYLNNQEVSVPQSSFLDTLMFNQLKPTLNRINNIRAQEVALYSHHLRLAGRTDCIAEFDGKLSVVDFKTARQAKEKSWIEHYFAQGAGYAVMWEELTGQPISRVAIIITVENDTPQVFVEKRDLWIPKLIAARDAWEAQNA